jgi:hypothetical protein
MAGRIVQPIVAAALIEPRFGRLKNSRRIATRYDRLARNHLAGLELIVLTTVEANESSTYSRNIRCGFKKYKMRFYDRRGFDRIS